MTRPTFTNPSVLSILAVRRFAYGMFAGTGKAKSFADNPKACWTKFSGTLKTDYTRDVQAKFDL